LGTNLENFRGSDEDVPDCRGSDEDVPDFRGSLDDPDFEGFPDFEGLVDFGRLPPVNVKKIFFLQNITITDYYLYL
jgi:hypothetical protein